MTSTELRAFVLEDELHRVRSWRYETLLQAGFTEEDSTEIAFYCDIDVHAAIDLLHRGCPSTLAAEIVL
jgi:hypothetical protein